MADSPFFFSTDSAENVRRKNSQCGKLRINNLAHKSKVQSPQPPHQAVAHDIVHEGVSNRRPVLQQRQRESLRRRTREKPPPSPAARSRRRPSDPLRLRLRLGPCKAASSDHRPHRLPLRAPRVWPVSPHPPTLAGSSCLQCHTSDANSTWPGSSIRAQWPCHLLNGTSSPRQTPERNLSSPKPPQSRTLNGDGQRGQSRRRPHRQRRTLRGRWRRKRRRRRTRKGWESKRFPGNWKTGEGFKKHWPTLRTHSRLLRFRDDWLLLEELGLQLQCGVTLPPVG